MEGVAETDTSGFDDDRVGKASGVGDGREGGASWAGLDGAGGSYSGMGCAAEVPDRVLFKVGPLP